ncbi:MAG: hypothetical protein V8R15_03810 [Bacilli bacterium]
MQKVSTDAHKFANILMPILGNIGNFLYILVAVVATTLFIFEEETYDYWLSSK